MEHHLSASQTHAAHAPPGWAQRTPHSETRSLEKRAPPGWDRLHAQPLLRGAHTQCAHPHPRVAPFPAHGTTPPSSDLRARTRSLLSPQLLLSVYSIGVFPGFGAPPRYSEGAWKAVPLIYWFWKGCRTRRNSGRLYKYLKVQSYSFVTNSTNGNLWRFLLFREDCGIRDPNASENTWLCPYQGLVNRLSTFHSFLPKSFISVNFKHAFWQTRSKSHWLYESRRTN